jgi:hypothetical protein
MATYEDYGPQGLFITAKRIKAEYTGKKPARSSKVARKPAKKAEKRPRNGKSVLAYFQNQTETPIKPQIPVPKRRKSVTFSSKVQIETSPDIDRRIGSGFYRGLIRKCTEAQREIYCILERHTSGGILPLGSGDDGQDQDEEDPVRVNDPNVGWDKDESPLELLQYWKDYPDEISGFIETLQRAVQERAPNSRLAVPYTFIPNYEKQVYRRVYISLRYSGGGFNVRKNPSQSLLIEAIHYQQMQQNARSTPIINLPKTRQMRPLNAINELEATMAELNAGPMMPASLALAFGDLSI